MNRRIFGALLVSVGLFALAGAGNMRAVLADKGSISAKVTDEAGTALAGVDVILEKTVVNTGSVGSGGGSLGRKSAGMDPTEGNGQGLRMSPVEEVGKGTTDKDGKIEFKDLKPGKYRVTAFSESYGRGYAAGRLEAGKSLELTIKMVK